MTNSAVLTKQQARRFILTHQGLFPPRRLSGKEDIMALFGRIGCIQYDPLNIVGSNPELVLQSRVDSFRPELLEDLLYRDRRLVDDWDKMMSIYPVEDRPNLIYRQIEDGGRSMRRNADAISEIRPLVRKAIEERGPLSSIDLNHGTIVDWSWGPTRAARAALEDMYYRGELVIHHRVHTRKVYDLAERHIDPAILTASDPHETIESYHDWHVHRRIRSLGIAWRRPGLWHGIHKARSAELRAALDRLKERNEINELTVEGVRFPFYVSHHDAAALAASLSGDSAAEEAAIIAPLDNLLWDRDLVSELFGFTYRWEVYKPVREREYGYYVLPVLYGDRFVARFEPGRDKKTGSIVIKNWWWEPDVTIDAAMKTTLHRCFSEFTGFLGNVKIKAGKALVRREQLDWLPSSRSTRSG